MAETIIVLNRECDDWPAELESALSASAAAVLAQGLATPAATVELGITLADDDTVHALNREHRGQDKPTNVLSFPLVEDGAFAPEAPGAPLLLGDVVLAWGTVAREAAEQGKSISAHAVHLVVHGVLHLLGHDHRDDAEAETMERLETEILCKLGIADPYSSSPAPSNLERP